MNTFEYTPQAVILINPRFFAAAKECTDLYQMRKKLSTHLYMIELESSEAYDQDAAIFARIRDTSQVLRNILKKRSEDLAGFSMAQVIYDIAHENHRPDLTPAFYADLYHLLLGVQGKGSRKAFDDIHLSAINDQGRPAAIHRSRQLDEICSEVDQKINQYKTGLDKHSVTRRNKRRDKIITKLNASLDDWQDWHWQIDNIVKEPELLQDLIKLSSKEKKAVKTARTHNLPFGITPYYLSLMDDAQSRRDTSIRAQVLPPADYVTQVISNQERSGLDFMGEEDTSPFDLITRRYPSICIFKPFNTCPQICVYCQRNWEIDDAMAPKAFAGMQQIDAAIRWIKEHPTIHEVLITGGDPLAMGDVTISNILAKIADISTVDRIRIGTRIPVTMPMRITADLAEILAQFRELGRRELAITTHVQNPYEITPELVKAVNRLRSHGLPVYNQLVYTYFVSKRFEASALRRHLRLVGIDPYYTFNTKGKDETLSYRVPISRLVMEQQEEARLLPGLERTDEAVFNVPRLGKNYLKSREHRDLLAILPNGARVYEFYAWEKNLSNTTNTYSYVDVPILNYLKRLEKDGENLQDYDTIWYYF
ncbi:MAG: KamA family radical SAM protein [Thermodesulfobacteriota bacterium]|nr:KamA family radical SAM protein [Thermodesulfobacteriota bacterium]